MCNKNVIWKPRKFNVS